MGSHKTVLKDVMFPQLAELSEDLGIFTNTLCALEGARNRSGVEVRVGRYPGEWAERNQISSLFFNRGGNNYRCCHGQDPPGLRNRTDTEDEERIQSSGFRKRHPGHKPCGVHASWASSIETSVGRDLVSDGFATVELHVEENAFIVEKEERCLDLQTEKNL